MRKPKPKTKRELPKIIKDFFDPTTVEAIEDGTVPDAVLLQTLLNFIAEIRPEPQRKYLPTLADLVDRLCIVQLKAVFIGDHRDEYMAERAAIEHDIDLILRASPKRVGATEVHAIIVLMLANRFIWENESKARLGGSEQDALLKLTHSINGVRNSAKNQLSALDLGRKDYKVDALAADLPKEFGNWRVFE